jgi:hypothetical protein
MVGESTSLRATTSQGKYRRNHFTARCLMCESLESVASASRDAYGYDQQPYSRQTAGQLAQYHSGFLSQNDSFASTVASETSTATPAPSNSKCLFCFVTWRGEVLTDCDQLRSTTGGTTRAD